MRAPTGVADRKHLAAMADTLLAAMPDDVLAHILDVLRPRERAALGQTCRGLRRLVWQHRLARRFLSVKLGAPDDFFGFLGCPLPRVGDLAALDSCLTKLVLVSDHAAPAEPVLRALRSPACALLTDLRLSNVTFGAEADPTSALASLPALKTLDMDRCIVPRGVRFPAGLERLEMPRFEGDHHVVPQDVADALELCAPTLHTLYVVTIRDGVKEALQKMPLDRLRTLGYPCKGPSSPDRSQRRYIVPGFSFLRPARLVCVCLQSVLPHRNMRHRPY